MGDEHFCQERDGEGGWDGDEEPSFSPSLPRGAAALETPSLPLPPPLFSSAPPTLASEHSHFVTGAEAASGGAANAKVTFEGEGLSLGGCEVTEAPCGGESST